MPFTEDLDVFLAPGDFARAVTVKSTSLNAIFDAAYAEDFDIEGASPRLTCASADLPADLAHGDSAVVGSTTYKVRNIQPDGTGITVLVLEEQ